MQSRFDSAQVSAALGTILSYSFANYDRMLAASCALAGLGYTIWKWRREARRAAAESAPPIRPLRRN